MAKIIIFIRSFVAMLYEYPGNWDALANLFYKATNLFIALKP